MKTDLKIINLAGEELNLYLSDLANLRIKLFRAFPYLYESYKLPRILQQDGKRI
jgi:hypothetical protein